MISKKQLKSLIQTVIKEELEKEALVIATTSGTDADATSDQKMQAKDALNKGQAVKFIKKGQSLDEKSKDKEDKEEKDDIDDKKDKKKPVHDSAEQAPCTECLAGKLAEIMDSFKRLSEAAKDAKHKRLAERVRVKLEGVKSALEALTAHESILEEKDKEVKTKVAGKHVAGVEKELKKLVKDDDTAKKILSKYPVDKALKVLSKTGEKQPSSEAVAKALLKRSIKEGFVK